MACVKGGRAFPIRYALGYGFYKSSEIKVIREYLDESTLQ